MIQTIGMLEFNSIAKGIETCDVMLKAAEVSLIRTSTVCPGKYIIITENGTSKKKWGNLEEERKDEYRIDFLREQLREVSRAISLGIPVDGYFHWSVMDTNEIYVRGYDHIFGLRQVDFETKERFRRDSWYYYQRVIADGAVD